MISGCVGAGFVRCGEVGGPQVSRFGSCLAASWHKATTFRDPESCIAASVLLLPKRLVRQPHCACERLRGDHSARVLGEPGRPPEVISASREAFLIDNDSLATRRWSVIISAHDPPSADDLGEAKRSGFLNEAVAALTWRVRPTRELSSRPFRAEC